MADPGLFSEVLHIETRHTKLPVPIPMVSAIKSLVKRTSMSIHIRHGVIPAPSPHVRV